jgi:hypothetical protein
MNRSVLTQCRLFGALSYKNLSMLLGCLGASYHMLAPGATMLTDRIVVVLSGQISTPGRTFRPSEVLLSDGRSRSITASERSEALFISSKRLQNPCKNACAAHRAVVSNLVALSLEHTPVVAGSYAQ